MAVVVVVVVAAAAAAVVVVRRRPFLGGISEKQTATIGDTREI